MTPNAPTPSTRYVVRIVLTVAATLAVLYLLYVVRSVLVLVFIAIFAGSALGAGQPLAIVGAVLAASWVVSSWQSALRAARLREQLDDVPGWTKAAGYAVVGSIVAAIVLLLAAALGAVAGAAGRTVVGDKYTSEAQLLVRMGREIARVALERVGKKPTDKALETAARRIGIEDAEELLARL